MSKQKPLLWDEELAEQTERDLEAVDVNAQMRIAEDPNWIPGYSEFERLEELERAEYGTMAWQQRAHQARQLGVSGTRPPIHIKRVRMANLAGMITDNVLIDQAQYHAQGYRPMKVEDLERYGLKVPPLYTVFADGTIRRGDVALWFVDAPRAKKNRAEKEARTREAEDRNGSTGQATGIPIDFEASRDQNFSL